MVSEADQLRRAMATFKFTGGVSRFKDKLVSGMIKNGYTPDFAEKTFGQLEGFGSYGFPESHAASFALIAYASNYIKCHHPDVFCAALRNSQPMGFYAPAQIVRDAREHGVEVRPVCVNRSRWDAPRNLSRAWAATPSGLACGWCAGLRRPMPPGSWPLARINPSIASMTCGGALVFLPLRWLSCRRPTPSLHRYASNGVTHSGRPRHCATSRCPCLRRPPNGKHGHAEQQEPKVELRQMTAGHNVVEDYSHTGLSLREHPISFLRRELAERRVVTCAEAMSARDGRWLMGWAGARAPKAGVCQRRDVYHTRR